MCKNIQRIFIVISFVEGKLFDLSASFFEITRPCTLPGYAAFGIIVSILIPFQVALKLDPESEITKYGGTFPGPLTEIEVRYISANFK